MHHLYTKLQQQITDLWNAQNKLVAEVTEDKRVAVIIKESAVKSDERVKLVAEVAEIKTTVSRLLEKQQDDNWSHIEKVNLTAKVRKTLNDMNKRKKNVMVTGLPEVASRSSDMISHLESSCNRVCHSTYMLLNYLKQCSQRIYLSRLFRSQGLSIDQMNTVFVGLIVSRLLYALHAWGVLVSAGQAGRVNAF